MGQEPKVLPQYGEPRELGDSLGGGVVTHLLVLFLYLQPVFQDSSEVIEDRRVGGGRNRTYILHGSIDGMGCWYDNCLKRGKLAAMR